MTPAKTRSSNIELLRILAMFMIIRSEEHTSELQSRFGIS